MPRQKTDVISFRATSDLKALLRAAADSQRRSLTNMVEVAILDWCERNKVAAGKAQGAAGTPGKGKQKPTTKDKA
jgi:predicted transcriptional regulator